MPCYRCGTRQTDPDRGSSPWLRGVRADRQVLICPGCQGSGEWVSDVDRCPVCASIRLVRRLGENECRDCGHVGESVAVGSATQLGTGAADGMTAPGLAAPGLAASGLTVPGVAAPGLAEEVEQALARVLRRHHPRPAQIP